MGLFGLGKKKEEQKPSSKVPPQAPKIQEVSDKMPELPEFPSLPEEDDHVSEFPKYEPTVADIKKEVARGTEEEMDIPVRNQSFAGKKMVSATVGPSDFGSSQSFTFTGNQPVAPSRKISFSEEKPLFIRIDSYKEAMHTLEALKAKLEDAEEVFRALEEVRSQEEEKLEAWRRDLSNIKEKLVSIDKDLFEV